MNDASAVRAPLRAISDLPGPEPRWLLGNARELRSRPLHLVLEDWSRTFGATYRFQIGPKVIVATRDADMIDQVLRQRPATFRRSSRVGDVFEETGVKGVFTAEGAAWQRQRELVNSIFNTRHLKNFFPTLLETAERLLARWDEAAKTGTMIDLQDDLMRFTIDITTTLAFGMRTNTLQDEHSELIDAINIIFPTWSRRIHSPIAYWRWFRLKQDRELERAMRDVKTFLDRAIAGAQESLQERPWNRENPTNLLEAMLVARDEHGDRFSRDVIFGNAVNLLLAGEDTTANTMAWAVHFLIDNPKWTGILRDEAVSVFPKSRLPADQRSATRLDHVLPVVNEAMRLKPVGPFLNLEALEDTVVSDLVLKKGDKICLLLRLNGVDPEIIDRADVFEPERWQSEGAVAKLKRRGMFTPFGGGQRICPGRRLALLEMRVVLSMLFANFEVERVGDARDVREHLGFTMSPKGLRVKLKNRGHAPRSVTLPVALRSSP